MQHAVLAQPDAVGLFVGFEVDVRGAAVDRVQQDLVDVADDRRIVDVEIGLVAFCLVVVAANVEVFEVCIEQFDTVAADVRRRGHGHVVVGGDFNTVTERGRRALAMVSQMDLEGFGDCSNHAECEASCPKEISIDVIATMNADYMKAKFKNRELHPFRRRNR